MRNSMKTLGLIIALTLTSYGFANAGTCEWGGNTGGSFSRPFEGGAFSVTTTGKDRCLKKTITESQLNDVGAGIGTAPCGPTEVKTVTTGGGFTTNKAFSANSKNESVSIMGIFTGGYSCFDPATQTYSGELDATITGGTGAYTGATGSLHIVTTGSLLSSDPASGSSFLDVQAVVTGTVITP